MWPTQAKPSTCRQAPAIGLLGQYDHALYYPGSETQEVAPHPSQGYSVPAVQRYESMGVYEDTKIRIHKISFEVLSESSSKWDSLGTELLSTREKSMETLLFDTFQQMKWKGVP